MRNYMISNFVDKIGLIMLCDGNEKTCFIRDFDAKYI